MWWSKSRAGISVSNHRQAQSGPLPSSNASSVSTEDVGASSDSELSEDEDEISWDVGKFVICRVPDSYRRETKSDEKFWVGKIVKHQKGDEMADDDHVRLHWYERQGQWTYKMAWKPCPSGEGQKLGQKRKGGQPRTARSWTRWVDYVDKKSIEGNIKLTKKGRITKKSIKWIEDWVVELWQKNPVSDNHMESEGESQSD